MRVVTHQVDKLIEGDLVVDVHVMLFEHVLDLFVRHDPPVSVESLFQAFIGDAILVGSVEKLESAMEVLFGQVYVRVESSSYELPEADLAVLVLVHLLNDFLELLLVLVIIDHPDRLVSSRQFIGGDTTIEVVINCVERIAKTLEVLLIQHCCHQGEDFSLQSGGLLEGLEPIQNHRIDPVRHRLDGKCFYPRMA